MLVFIGLLIKTEKLNLPELNIHKTTLKHLIGVEVEIVHWSIYIYLADNKIINSLENGIFGEILALLWWTSFSLQSGVRFSPTLVSETVDLL